jgi:hypothetical protein
MLKLIVVLGKAAVTKGPGHERQIPSLRLHNVVYRYHIERSPGGEPLAFKLLCFPAGTVTTPVSNSQAAG